MNKCPVFPRPQGKRASLWNLFFKKRRSWMDGLYDRSYKMKMGEIRLPGVHLYMVNQPDLVRRVLVDDAPDFPKHKLMGDILAPLMGESIFTTNGTQWRKQRDMLDPAFDAARIQRVFNLMQAAATAMEKRLESQVAQSSVDIDHEMTYVTADIIFRTIMSVDLQEEKARDIFDAFVAFQKSSAHAALRQVFKFPQWWPFGRAQEKKRLSDGQRIRRALEVVIRPRYDAGASDGDDILSAILRAVDPDTGDRFSFDEIVDQVAMLFLAGHETSASALTWSLYLLAFDQDMQERAYQEVKTLTGADGITPQNLRRLDLVRDVFREALRLYPPVGFFARECAHATKMRDKKMTKGSMVVVAPWLIHRHEDYWENPAGFDPERFSRMKGKVPLRDIYLPFGMGPRVCIGAAFAQQEAVIILATLLRRWKFDMVPGFEPQPVGRITVRSDNGLFLRMTERGAA